MKKRYIVMGIMSLVIFILFYTYSLKILNALDAISTTNIKGSDLDKNNVIEPIHDHELLFLLAGVDQNDGKNGEHTRTDTLMLIKANVDTGSFDIISIPRDCRIKVNGKLDKVNHAHSYGEIKLTMKSLRNLATGRRSRPPPAVRGRAEPGAGGPAGRRIGRPGPPARAGRGPG